MKALIRQRLAAALWVNDPANIDPDDLVEALLPIVEDIAKKRAAEELRAVATTALEDRVRTWVLNLLRDRADKLDSPAAAPPPTPMRGCTCVDCVAPSEQTVTPEPQPVTEEQTAEPTPTTPLADPIAADDSATPTSEETPVPETTESPVTVDVTGEVVP